MAEAVIQLKNENERWWEFEVSIQEEKSSSQHTVTLGKEFYEKMAAGRPLEPSEIVKKTFEFLLEREAKETILRSFDLTSVSRYFPDYEEALRKSLHIKS